VVGSTARQKCYSIQDYKMDETEKPDFDEVQGDDHDPVGQTKSRKVQTPGRVDIPDSFLDHIGAPTGDNVMVVLKDDHVEILPADISKLRGGD